MLLFQFQPQNYANEIFFLKNTKYVFCFSRDNEGTRFSKICFQSSSKNSFYKLLKNFMLKKINYLKIVETPIIMSIFKSFQTNQFFYKSRLRFSGLGYGLEFDKTSSPFLKINTGFTTPQMFPKPLYISVVKTNKKCKKALFAGYSEIKISNFSASIRKVRVCDVYKGKGIR